MDNEDIIIESMTQSAEEIQRALESEGYTDIQVEGAEPKPPAETTSSEFSPDAGNAGGGEGESGATSEAAHTQEQQQRESGSRKLKRRIQEKDAEIATLRAKLAELGGKPPANAGETAEHSETSGEGKTETHSETSTDSAEPKLEDYDSMEEWMKAWNRWDRQRESQETTTREKPAELTPEQKAEVEAWNDKLDDARDKYPDFDQVALNENITVSQVLAAAGKTYDEVTDLMYYLGKHPEEAKRISEATLVNEGDGQAKIARAFRIAHQEIAKILSQLSAATAASREARTPAAETTTTSQQPPKVKPTPPSPVGNRGAHTRSISDPDAVRDMSNDDYRRQAGLGS